ITFAPALSADTIYLLDDLPLIFNNTSVDASTLAAPVSIDGLTNQRVFFVSGLPDSTQSVPGTGLPDPDGAQPVNVALKNLVVQYGSATGGNGAGGGMGAGGGLFVNKMASVTLTNVSFSGNYARGGSGGLGSGAGGGALESLGNPTLVGGL